MYKIFGHSHRQFMFSRKFAKYINPGSVGVPIGELIKQSILNNVTIKWGNVLIKTMQTGIDYTQLYLREARKIARECGLSEDLDEIPMEVWHEARKNLDL